jgi:hypothetical protein
MLWQAACEPQHVAVEDMPEDKFNVWDPSTDRIKYHLTTTALKVGRSLIRGIAEANTECGLPFAKAHRAEGCFTRSIGFVMVLKS